MHDFSADPDFNEAFLLTFCSFMSPEELLSALEERYVVWVWLTSDHVTRG